jgi:hypothetical protein
MDKKDEIIGRVEALTTDIDDRLQNLIAIKGERFTEMVGLCLSVHSILEMAGNRHVPHEVRGTIVVEMCADLVSKMLEIGLDNNADRMECIQFAKNINTSMRNEAQAISKILKEG